MSHCVSCEVQVSTGCDDCSAPLCLDCFQQHECEIGVRETVGMQRAQEIYQMINDSKTFSPSPVPVVITPTDDLLLFLGVSESDILDEIPLSLQARARDNAMSIMLATLINFKLASMKNPLFSQIRRENRDHIKRSLRKVYNQRGEEAKRTERDLLKNAKYLLDAKQPITRNDFVLSFLRSLSETFPSLAEYQEGNFLQREKVYPKSQNMVRNPERWQRDANGLYFKYARQPTLYKGPPTRFYSITQNGNLGIDFIEENGKFAARVNFYSTERTPKLGDSPMENYYEFDYLAPENRFVTFNEAVAEELLTERGSLLPVDDDDEFQHFNLGQRHLYEDASSLINDIKNLSDMRQMLFERMLAEGQWVYERVE